MHMVSPLGDYRLTYNDAVALCNANDARLATYDELLAAFYYGMWDDILLRSLWKLSSRTECDHSLQHRTFRFAMKHSG